jgi:large subunit ribosomal protein L9
MKVILLTDIPRVGNKYDVKDFKEGYAQNALIAKGLACLATNQELAKLENKKKLINEMKKKEEDTFLKLISDIGNTIIEIKTKVNEKGHLFKAINPRDVILAIKEKTGIIIEEKFINMQPIKEIGLHKITIKKGDRIGECEILIIKN